MGCFVAFAEAIVTSCGCLKILRPSQLLHLKIECVKDCVLIYQWDQLELACLLQQFGLFPNHYLDDHQQLLWIGVCDSPSQLQQNPRHHHLSCGFEQRLGEEELVQVEDLALIWRDSEPWMVLISRLVLELSLYLGFEVLATCEERSV